MPSRFSSNSEAFASELLENPEDYVIATAYTLLYVCGSYFNHTIVCSTRLKWVNKFIPPPFLI